MAVRTTDSPVGRLRLTAQDGALAAIAWCHAAAPEAEDSDPVLQAAATQLAAYFAGTRQRFALPLAMQAIPYGEVMTYGALAAVAGGNPRAVGTACGANPIPIVIPCHRVVAAGGRLGGYSGRGGARTKAALLRLEGAAGVLL